MSSRVQCRELAAAERPAFRRNGAEWTVKLCPHHAGLDDLMTGRKPKAVALEPGAFEPVGWDGNGSLVEEFP